MATKNELLQTSTVAMRYNVINHERNIAIDSFYRLSYGDAPPIGSQHTLLYMALHVHTPYHSSTLKSRSKERTAGGVGVLQHSFQLPVGSFKPALS